MAKGTIKGGTTGGGANSIYITDSTPLSSSSDTGGSSDSSSFGTATGTTGTLAPPEIMVPVGTILPTSSSLALKDGDIVECSVTQDDTGKVIANVSKVIPGGTAYVTNQSNLTVTAGQSALVKNGASVTGKVTVDGGTLIITEASKAAGNLQLLNGGFVLCEDNSVISGTDFKVDGSNGTLIIRNCKVNGKLSTGGNKVVTLISNTHQKDITSTNDGTVTIQQNNISGNLTVTGAASCNTTNNTVSGTVNTPGCPA
ncbi:MAG TPA: hypothetical protein VI112_02565 [Bacteroidia bacterium]|jgi:hypothetical protein